MHLRSTKWVDWTCIKVGKSLLSICNKNQFKVNRWTSHTHGFTSVDYCNLYFNWLFNLLLVTDPRRMLAVSYFGRNWSVCMESRTGNMLFVIDQHDIYGFIWRTAWLIAVFTAKRPSSGEHPAGQEKNKSGVQFFLDGAYLVQLFIRSSAYFARWFFWMAYKKIKFRHTDFFWYDYCCRSNWKAFTFRAG